MAKTVENPTNIMVTEKTTKAEMITMLEPMLKAGDFLSKNLRDRLSYTLKVARKDPRAVTKKDLLEFFEELTELRPDVVAAIPVEAQTKKLQPKKRPAPTPDPVEDEGEDDTPPPPKKGGKPKIQKNKPRVVPAMTTKGADNHAFAIQFPDEFDAQEALGTLIAARDQYTTFEDIQEAFNRNEDIYILMYWTKRQIKEFRYAEGAALPRDNVPASFAHDLDILTPVYLCESIDRVHCISQYTEAMFAIDAEDLTYIEDTDPRSGETFRTRMSNGCEYEIYVPKE